MDFVPVPKEIRVTCNNEQIRTVKEPDISKIWLIILEKNQMIYEPIS